MQLAPANAVQGHHQMLPPSQYDHVPRVEPWYALDHQLVRATRDSSRLASRLVQVASCRNLQFVLHEPAMTMMTIARNLIQSTDVLLHLGHLSHHCVLLQIWDGWQMQAYLPAPANLEPTQHLFVACYRPIHVQQMGLAYRGPSRVQPNIQLGATQLLAQPATETDPPPFDLAACQQSPGQCQTGQIQSDAYTIQTHQNRQISSKAQIHGPIGNEAISRQHSHVGVVLGHLPVIAMQLPQELQPEVASIPHVCGWRGCACLNQTAASQFRSLALAWSTPQGCSPNFQHERKGNYLLAFPSILT